MMTDVVSLFSEHVWSLRRDETFLCLVMCQKGLIDFGYATTFLIRFWHTQEPAGRAYSKLAQKRSFLRWQDIEARNKG